MACATASLHVSFRHHRLHSARRIPKPTRTLAPISLPMPNAPRRAHFTIPSVDISQEGKPVSEQEQFLAPPAPEGTDAEPEIEDGDDVKLDPRRFEEKFAVLNTGVYDCRSCGYRYDQAVGDPSYPIAPGLQFAKLPDDWRCPTCGAAKTFFVSKSVEIAGFAQNQQFGLGGNSLTSGQKALLIYGTLLFFFVLFLSGYFIQ